MCVCVCVFACLFIYIYIYIYIYIWEREREWQTRTHISYACMYTYKHRYILDACTQTYISYIYSQTYTYTHTHTHTHIHTHTHTYKGHSIKNKVNFEWVANKKHSLHLYLFQDQVIIPFMSIKDSSMTCFTNCYAKIFLFTRESVCFHYMDCFLTQACRGKPMLSIFVNIFTKVCFPNTSHILL